MTSNNIPRVAVLLAAYNGMRWIEEQVESILAQQGVEVTLFVSVDLSTDGTEAWVVNLAKNNTNVFILPYGERFGGAGPNFFRLVKDVDLTGFDAVAFSDQDDIWFGDKLLRACQKLQSSEYDVYSSNVTAFWGDGKKLLINKAQPQKKYDYFFEAAGPGCTYVFNQDSILAFQHFLLELGDRVESVSLHDWLAYSFCRERGFNWYIDAEPSMLYRQHGGNQVGTNTGFKAYRKRFQLITQKWYRQQVMAIIGLVSPGRVGLFEQRMFLVKNFLELRRRPRDRLFLLVMIVLGFF